MAIFNSDVKLPEGRYHRIAILRSSWMAAEKNFIIFVDPDQPAKDQQHVERDFRDSNLHGLHGLYVPL